MCKRAYRDFVGIDPGFAATDLQLLCRITGIRFEARPKRAKHVLQQPGERQPAGPAHQTTRGAPSTSNAGLAGQAAPATRPQAAYAPLEAASGDPAVQQLLCDLALAPADPALPSLCSPGTAAPAGEACGRTCRILRPHSL